MATNMTFVDFVTPVPADWLNNVNTVVNSTTGTLPVNNLTVGGNLSVNGTTALVGTVTGPTPTQNDDSTKVATSHFVNVAMLSILAFGGKNDGVSDNSTALANALAAAQQVTGKVLVYFPPGKYVFNSTVTYTFPNTSAAVSLVGAGIDITELSWPTATIGLQINYLGAFNSFQVSDMSFTCGTTNTATAIFLHQNSTSIPNPALGNMSLLTNVCFRGADGYGVTDVWAFAVDVFAVSNINFSNVNICGNITSTAGNGVRLKGLNAGCQGVAANFSNCFFNIVGIGIIYDQWYQGVSVSQCNLTGGPIGIQAPLGLGGQDQLIVSDCQFNNATAGMQLSQPIPGLMVSNCLIILQQASARGITCSNYCNFQIVGNQFGSASVLLSTIGVYFNTPQGGSIVGGTITGNSFVSMTTGVVLDTASTKINVQSNAYLGCTTSVTNTGTANTIGGGSS